MKQNWKRVAAGILAAVLSLCGTTTAWAAEDSALVTSAYGSAENAEEPQEGQAGIPEAGAGEETQAEPESGADAEMPGWRLLQKRKLRLSRRLLRKRRRRRIRGRL